ASISSATGFAPFELNYGYMPSMIQELREAQAAPKGLREFALTALQNIADAHDAIIEARVFQKHYADVRRREEPSIGEGSFVYLST
ncbi:uncharacterized protein SCHCODRAFT_02480392, partial [Schizophyllum commune H4-8]|uniref:uncharacterized protein n=1 Tax=Schizophyllum commune (strain H4-8 / FGSC 9210) TaxID=578458 RepID=UPI002160CC55